MQEKVGTASSFRTDKKKKRETARKTCLSFEEKEAALMVPKKDQGAKKRTGGERLPAFAQAIVDGKSAAIEIEAGKRE